MIKKKKQSDIKKGKVPIKWHTPDGMLSRYASHALVHVLENEIKISFFELQPSIRLNPDDPLPTEARADCIANIIMSPHKIPAFIEALQKQLTAFIQVQTERQGHVEEQQTKS